MGITYADLELFAPDGVLSTKLRLIVDTGSLLTWVPGDVARGLGLVPTGTRTFRAIDGWTFGRPIADALVECAGQRGIRRIVFAESSDLCVIGADTMEGLGLEVDPTTKTIRPVDALPAATA